MPTAPDDADRGPAAPPLPEVVDLEDPRAIRAIAHPARLIVIDALYDRGLALTATQAAALAGTTPSAMSYHLRALERYGLVRRAPATGDGRERPWVRVAKDLRIRPPAPAAERAVLLATSAVVATAMDITRDKLLESLERSRDEARRAPLDDVTTFSRASLRVTPEEAKELLEALRARIEPLRDEVRHDPPAGADVLTVVLASIPDPEAAIVQGSPDPSPRPEPDPVARRT